MLIASVLPGLAHTVDEVFGGVCARNGVEACQQ